MGWHMLNPLDTLHPHNHGAQLDFIKYCTFISAKQDNNKEELSEGEKITKTSSQAEANLFKRDFLKNITK